MIAPQPISDTIGLLECLAKSPLDIISNLYPSKQSFSTLFSTLWETFATPLA
jgi:hypothetical protein